MDKIYNNIYRVVNLFQENSYQKIYTGESLEDPNLIVVINELIKTDSKMMNLIDSLKNNLDHLLYFTENDSSAIFITKYEEGMSIFQMIDNIPNTTNFRTNILHDYLNTLRKFDSLPYIFQYILSSHSQFYIKDHDLIHNELIIIDEEKISSDIEFVDVKKRIKEFALRMLDFTAPEKDSELILLLNSFFKNIDIDPSLDSIEKIYDDYKRIYIYDMYLDKKNVSTYSTFDDRSQSGNNAASDFLNDRSSSEKKKFYLPFSNNKIFLFRQDKYAANPLFVALIIMAIAIALFAVFTPMINKIKSNDIPIASFEKEKMENQWKFINMSKTFSKNNKIEEVEWTVYSDNELIDTFNTYNLNLSFTTEGIYRISLRVMDSFGNWSDAYTEEIYHTQLDLEPIEDQDNLDSSQTEPLDSYTITFDDQVSFDEEVVKAGSKSIKMIFSGDETHGINLDKLFLDNNIKISLWVKATDDSPVTVTVTGLNGNDKIFSMSKVQYPPIDEWKQISFNTNTAHANNLRISINAEDMIIWIDDIEINSYK
ncbi:MAG: hypothetical protein JW702_07490 [Clostridiales bacterium]|nr:hypothetical protein [Clostridiales bacterium]